MKKIVYIGNDLVRTTNYTPQLTTLCNLLVGEGIEVIISSSAVGKLKRLLDMLVTVFRHRKTADIILLDTFGTSSFFYAVVVSQLARLLRCAYVPVLRGGDLPNRMRKNPFLSRLLFRNSLKNVCPSDYLKAALEEQGYHGMVIPNILEVEKYTFKKRTQLASKLLYVRAFQSIYNPMMAVRVLFEVQQKYPEATLCMIGPHLDHSFEDTKALAEELGVTESIRYTGVLSKKEWHTIASDYDIFINTTTIDNTPVSVMEAMALGLPVVSTNVGGIPYLLEDGVEACLVNSDDHKAMSGKILDLLEGRIDGVAIAKRARLKVEQFDWSVVKQQWFRLFNMPSAQKSWFERCYHSSPIFVQNFLISVYGFYWKRRRFGGKFKQYLKEFKSREAFTQKEWRVYQTKELRKLLVHAYTTVPFYTELYTRHGFLLEDFKRFELVDLWKLPYLEKEDLRKFGTTTLLSAKKEKGTFVSSSGSSGTPVRIYLSKTMHRKWNAAYEHRVRNWAGVHHKLSRGMIGGRRILDSRNPKPPYFRYNLAEYQVYFSAYNINDNTTEKYILGMCKYRIDYLVGYAMSIYLLADQIVKSNLKAPQLKGVLTSSEQLTDKMRVTIGKAFGCKVFDAYSGVEACGLISENSDGELLFSPDTGIMEVLDSDGSSVKNGEVGEVVATGLLNFDQPLIRYRIGDRVQMAQDQQTKSGIEMPLVKSIEGRIEDVVVAEDGSEMVRFHGVFLDIPNLMAGQIEQFSSDKIGVNLKVDIGFDRNNEQILEARIQSQLGNVVVQFQYLDEIPKNKNGKFQAVVSHIV